MSPDFLCLTADTPVAKVLEAVRTSQFAPEALNVVFADGVDGEVIGSASVVKLIQADPVASFGSVCEVDPLHVHVDWDLGEIVRKMSDFNLIVVPVLDEQHDQILGVVTVDDVLELMLPTGFRRDFGRTAAED
jgi:Mg/Co/Ni transporter MgtE